MNTAFVFFKASWCPALKTAAWGCGRSRTFLCRQNQPHQVEHTPAINKHFTTSAQNFDIGRFVVVCNDGWHTSWVRLLKACGSLPALDSGVYTWVVWRCSNTVQMWYCVYQKESVHSERSYFLLSGAVWCGVYVWSCCVQQSSHRLHHFKMIAKRQLFVGWLFYGSRKPEINHLHLLWSRCTVPWCIYCSCWQCESLDDENFAIITSNLEE